MAHLLDAPAGKHWWLGTKDGDYVFAGLPDGTYVVDGLQIQPAFKFIKESGLAQSSFSSKSNKAPLLFF